MAKVATRRAWVKFSVVSIVDKDMVKLQIINWKVTNSMNSSSKVKFDAINNYWRMLMLR